MDRFRGFQASYKYRCAKGHFVAQENVERDTDLIRYTCNVCGPGLEYDPKD